MINAPFSFVLITTLAYLIGAVPFSVIVTRLKGIDLTKVGSGNFGATNVYRALGIKYAIFVFTLDMLKGVLPVGIGVFLFSSPIIYVIIGGFAILGHAFSLFLGFKGGKGVATAAGVFLVLTPLPLVITCCIAVALITIFRIVSIGTLVACVVLPILTVIFGEPRIITYLVSFLSLFIVIKHRANIQRLIKGTENKI